MFYSMEKSQPASQPASQSVSQSVKKFPPFMEPEGSLSCLQGSATGPIA